MVAATKYNSTKEKKVQVTSEKRMSRDSFTAVVLSHSILAWRKCSCVIA